MKEYSHGGDIYSHYEKYGVYPVDFSSSLNPLIAPIEVSNAFISSYAKSFAYPPHDYKLLRQKLAEKENIAIENIILSNGASEIIYFIPYAFNKANALINAPAFSEYEKSLHNKNIDYYYLKIENQFKLQKDIIDYVKKDSIIYLTNPDNPVGNIIDENILYSILEKSAQCGSIVVLDECFIDLTYNGKSYVSLIKKYDNLIIIKAFTKTYAFAGFRLGYCISSKKNIEILEEYLPPWNISMPAYICGIAALEDEKFLQDSISYIEKEKEYLLYNLKDFGFLIYGSQANYVFFYCDEYKLKEKLLEKHILIRDCSNYKGLSKGYFRVAVKKHDDNEKLINALKEILNG